MAGTETRRCLLVLGMHRCGTSALTRILALAGAALPENLLPGDELSNPTGHWEPEPLVACHDRWLARLGSSWHDWRPLHIDQLDDETKATWRQEILSIIAQEYGEAPLFVIKDPRICRFAGFFMDTLEQAGITPLPIIAFRNPVEIAASLARRNNFSDAAALLLTLRHLLDAEHSTRQRARVFVRFDALFSHWPQIIAKITETFGLQGQLRPARDIRQQVEQFIAPELRHFTIDENALADDPVFNVFGRELWNALRMLCGDPADASAMQTLERLNRQMDSVAAICHALLAHMFQDIVHNVHGMRGKYNLAGLNLENIHGAAPHVQHVKECLRQHQQRLSLQLDDEIGLLQEALAGARARMTELEQNIARLQEQLQDKENEQHALQAQHAELVQRYTIMRNSLSWKSTRPFRAMRRKLRAWWS